MFCWSGMSKAEDPINWQDPPSDERLEAAKAVLEIKGARQQMKNACILGLDSQMKTNPSMSKALYEGLKQEMTKDENIDTLLSITAASLAKRFNIDELKELGAFYATPLGKRLSAEEAAIAVEGVEAGMKWGTELGGRVDKALRKKKDLN